MRTLVIAPHCDDEVLGAGGLIRKRVLCDQDVMVAAVFERKPPAELELREMLEYRKRQRAHFYAAADTLGYKHFADLMKEEGEPQNSGYYGLLGPLENIIRDWGPTEIVIPGRSDLNQDHRWLNEVCRIALRACNRNQGQQNGPIMRVLEMISHDQLDGPAQANYGVPMTDKMVETVISAMLCYEDEMRKDPHPRCVENIWARYRFYGAHFGYRYAEPFRIVYAVE